MGSWSSALKIAAGPSNDATVVHGVRAAALHDGIAYLRASLEQARRASEARDAVAATCSTTSHAGRRQNGVAGEGDSAEVAAELGQALAGAEAACDKIAAAARVLADDELACGAGVAWREHVEEVEQAEPASDRPPPSRGPWPGGQRQPETHAELLEEATQVAFEEASQEAAKKSSASLEDASKEEGQGGVHSESVESINLQRQMEALTNLIKDQHRTSVANHSSVLLHLQVFKIGLKA